MYIHEIFKSISGETSNAGVPMTFVRLHGCNVKCSYCDQPQKPEDRHKMSIQKVVDKVRQLGINNVCITGGEPLVQKEVQALVYELEGLGYKVQIETNGTIPLEQLHIRNYVYIMDVKCPSSGVHHKNNFSNMSKLCGKDEIKFVIKDREDYEYALKVLRDYPSRALVLFSPMFDSNNSCMIGQELIQWLLEDNPNYGNYRVQVQIHKILKVL